MPSAFRETKDPVEQSMRLSQIDLMQKQKGATAVNTALTAMKLGDAVMESKVLDAGAREVKSWFDPEKQTAEEAVEAIGRVPDPEKERLRRQAIRDMQQGYLTKAKGHFDSKADESEALERFRARGTETIDRDEHLRREAARILKPPKMGLLEDDAYDSEEVMERARHGYEETPEGRARQKAGMLSKAAARRLASSFAGGKNPKDTEEGFFQRLAGGESATTPPTTPAAAPAAAPTPAAAPAAPPALAQELDALTARMKKQPAGKNHMNRQRVRKAIKDEEISEGLAALLEKANLEAMGKPTAYGPKTFAAAKEMLANAPAPAAPAAVETPETRDQKLKQTLETLQGREPAPQPVAAAPERPTPMAPSAAVLGRHGQPFKNVHEAGNNAASMIALGEAERMAVTPTFDVRDPLQSAESFRQFAEQLMQEERLPPEQLPRNADGFVDLNQLRGLTAQNILAMAGRQVWSDEEMAVLSAIAREKADLDGFQNLFGRKYKDDAASAAWEAQRVRRTGSQEQRLGMYKSLAQIFKNVNKAHHLGEKPATERSIQFKNYRLKPREWRKKALKGGLRNIKAKAPHLMAQINYTATGGDSKNLNRFMEAPAWRNKALGEKWVEKDAEGNVLRVLKTNQDVIAEMGNQDADNAIAIWRTEQSARDSNRRAANQTARETRLSKQRLKGKAGLDALKANNDPEHGALKTELDNLLSKARAIQSANKKGNDSIMSEENVTYETMEDLYKKVDENNREADKRLKDIEADIKVALAKINKAAAKYRPEKTETTNLNDLLGQ